MNKSSGIQGKTQTTLQNLLQTGPLRLLLTGVYFLLGVRCDSLAQHWQLSACEISEQARRDAMLASWAGIPTLPERKRQVRRLWLSSKAINNSPDPNIRITGHDAWATRRAYPSVPGVSLANIRDIPPRRGRSWFKLGLAENTQNAKQFCDSCPALVPP